MKQFRRWIAMIAVLAAILSTQPSWSESPQKDGITQFTVPAAALRTNLLGDPPEVRVAVYLPPGYDTRPERRYPSLYLLHGYYGDIDYYGIREDVPGPQGMQLAEVIDKAIAEDGLKEMIVVVPEARNAYFGSFYVNSALTGNWEDAIVREVVPWIDARFR